MSYCVNCGVELAASETACPLCSTVVINPNEEMSGPRERPYPAYLETVARSVDKRYFSGLAAVLLFIPVLLCLIIDGLTGAPGLEWSGYVVGAIGVIMVVVLLPLGWGRKGVGVYMALDIAAILAYLFFIDAAVDGLKWFLPLAAPITLTAGGILWLQLHYFTQRRTKGILVFIAILLFGAGAITVAVEVFVHRYQGLSMMPHWSLYALVPCALTGAAFLILNRRNNWKESVKKRLFF